MKSTYPLFLVIICSSCITYQYATINSELKQENTDEFLVENDTLKVLYDFSGEYGPVRISIFNKLNTPLYVDWSKSALIVEGISRSYLTNQSTLEGNVSGTERRWGNGYSTQDASVRGTITENESVAFIPPQSWANEYQLNLNPNPFNLPTPGARYNSKKVNGVNIKSYYYNHGDSPLQFRSFLTLYVNKDMSELIYLDHSFWISEIAETELTPPHFSKQTDQFYIKKPMQ